MIARTAADLERHFASVQAIADTVTLPQALKAVATAAREEADIDALAARIKAGRETGAAKVAAWGELRAAALERAVDAPWLLAVSLACTRAQVNVLGRHLFVGAQLGNGGGAGAAALSPSPSSTLPPIPKAAQERFLEFGQTVTCRAPAGLRDVVAAACARACAPLSDLAALTPAPALLDALSSAAASVERGVVAAGWGGLLLPPAAAADSFFRAAEAAGGGPSATGDGAAGAAIDSLARALAAELAAVVESPPFAAAVRSAAAAAAGALAASLAEALAGDPLPLARIIPRAARAGNALLDAGTPLGTAAVARAGADPAVDALSAAVYSRGVGMV